MTVRRQRRQGDARHRDAVARGAVAGDAFGADQARRGAGRELVEIMFWRQGAAIPVVLGYMALTDRSLGAIRSNAFRGQAIRAAIGVTGMAFNFCAVLLLPLAEATTLALHRSDLRDDPRRAGAQGADRLAPLGRGRGGVRRRADRDSARQRARTVDRRAGRPHLVGVRRDRRDPVAPDRQGRSRR